MFRNGRGQRFGDDANGGEAGRSSGLSPRDDAAVRHISTLLFHLGSKGSLRDSIELGAVALEREYAAAPELFLRAFKICISQLPTKIGIYATVTGLINVRNVDMTKAIVGHMASVITAALQDNHFRTAKLAIRFLAECVNANIILPAQIIGLFDTLLHVTVEPDVKQERSDAFIFLVLATLPWVGTQLRDNAPDHLDRIMKGMTTYFLTRATQSKSTGLALSMSATSMYRTSDGSPYRQIDKLEMLWIQIQNLRDKNWESGIILRPHDLFDTVLSQGTQHEIPAIELPTTVTIIKFNYQPCIWIFDDALITGDLKWGHLPLTTDIARFVLTDTVIDIIRTFSLNHTEATQILLHLDTWFDPDYLDHHNIIVLESVIESIFSELLRLPKSQEKFVYYGTLIIDLCKSATDRVPSIFGRAIKTLFVRLDGPNVNGVEGMDVEGVRRLSELLALHLSNFGYQWKWSDWAHVLESPSSDTVMTDTNGDDEMTTTSVATSARFVFIRETLERCVRLSYWERIKGTIPESFCGHASGVFPDAAPSYRYSYESVETAGGDAGLVRLVSALNTSISQKSETTDVQACLDRIRRYVMGETVVLDDGERVEPFMTNTAHQGLVMSGTESTNPVMSASTTGSDAADRITRDALIQTVMYQGSKSFSHILNVIERYVSLLQSHAPTPESRIHVITITSTFWHNNTQMIEIILDKLINYRVVDPKTVLSWAMHPSVLDAQCTRFYVWSIMRNTVSKVHLKVTQISKKLHAVKSNVTSFVQSNDTGSEITMLESAYESAVREKKETLIFFFQKYVEVVTGKIAEMEALGVEPKITPWWRWVVGFFREMTRAYKDEFETVKVTMDTVLFTSEVSDERVLELWNEFKSMSEMHQDDIA